MAQRRQFLVLTVTAAAAALAGCAAAPVQAAAGRLIDVRIVDRSRGDAVLPEHRHRGANYVAGRPGDRYAVRLANRSGARVLVVLSVDGINAVSGESAATAQTGYVLAPWQTADITGWRKSDDAAAAFYFTALPDSYAARTDRPDNVGVIGVAVFREREQPPRPVPFEAAPWPSSSDRRGDAHAESARQGSAAGKPAAEPSAPAPASERDAATATRSERLGTGHGEREYAPITRTSFERATTQPAEVVLVRYDSQRNLIAGGVIARPRPWAPDPFPGYVPDPRS